jgi:hypothetical protein
MGEDAALNYVGSAIGNGIASDSYREMGRVTTRTLQLKTLDAAIASHPEKAGELSKLRARVLAGEENLAFDIEDASKMEVEYTDKETGEKKTRTANAIYRENGRISINRDLVGNANTPDGSARLLGAISEEVGEWAARNAGLEFYNDEGRKLDAGAVLGLQTMTSLSREAGMSEAPVMFALDSSEGRYDFSTDVSSLMKVSVNQFTPARLLANISGSFGDAQADWLPSMADVKKYALGLAKRVGFKAADQALTMGGVVLGVGEKGLDAVKGLAQLAGDVVGTGAYLNLKMVGADRMAEYLFGGSYKRMNALIDTTVKFVKENSVGQMAYEIFAKPLADGFVHSRDAVTKAERIARAKPEEYSWERADAYLKAGEELGKFGVDIALAVLSVTGAGAAAKSLFNVGTALGSRLAGRLAVSRGAGAASAIEGLAGEVTMAARAEAAADAAAAARAEASASRATQAATKGETAATATGKEIHKQLAAERRASGQYDLVNQPIANEAGEAIQVTKRVDLKTGKPDPESGYQTANPDAVDFDRGLILDDKPMGRPIAKDRQEIIRFIRAYEQSQGQLPRTIAIQRYDPLTGRPVMTELFKPSDFLPKPPKKP